MRIQSSQKNFKTLAKAINNSVLTGGALPGGAQNQYHLAPAVSMNINLNGAPSAEMFGSGLNN